MGKMSNIYNLDPLQSTLKTLSWLCMWMNSCVMGTVYQQKVSNASFQFVTDLDRSCRKALGFPMATASWCWWQGSWQSSTPLTLGYSGKLKPDLYYYTNVSFLREYTNKAWHYAIIMPKPIGWYFYACPTLVSPTLVGSLPGALVWGVASGRASATRCGKDVGIFSGAEVFLHPLRQPCSPLLTCVANLDSDINIFLHYPFTPWWWCIGVYSRIPIFFLKFVNWGIQHVTSDKQAPSALDYLGSMKEAVSLERRQAKQGTSRALKDVLAKVVAEYNKMCTNKLHKITTERKKLVQNLILVLHYTVFFWVPPPTPPKNN